MTEHGTVRIVSVPRNAGVVCVLWIAAKKPEEKKPTPPAAGGAK